MVLVINSTIELHCAYCLSLASPVCTNLESAGTRRHRETLVSASYRAHAALRFCPLEDIPYLKKVKQEQKCFLDEVHEVAVVCRGL